MGGAHLRNRSGSQVPLLAFFLALSLACATARFIVKSPSEYAGNFKMAYVSAWPTAVDLELNNDDHEVARGEFTSGRQRDISDRRGSIVLIDSDFWQSVTLIDDMAMFQAQNASAVVLATSYGTTSRRIAWVFIQQYRVRKDLHGKLSIPVFQVINAENADFIIAFDKASDPSSFSGVLTIAGVHNAWLDASNSSVSIVLQIGYFITPIVGLALVLVRLIPRLKYGKLEMRLPFVILSLESFSHLLRVILAIDPLGMRTVFDPFSALFWPTPHIAASLICHLIVLFYWNRAMHSFGATKNIDFLQKYVYVLIGAIVVIEIVSAVIRSLELFFVVLLVVQFFYITVELIVIIFIIYTAVGIFRYLRMEAGMSRKERTKAKILKMTKLVIASAILLLVFIGLTAAGFLEFFRHPYSEITLYMMSSICLSLIGIFETLVLKPVNKKHRDSMATDDTTGSRRTSRAINSANSKSDVNTTTSMSHINSVSDDKKTSSHDVGLKEEKAEDTHEGDHSSHTASQSSESSSSSTASSSSSTS